MIAIVASNKSSNTVRNSNPSSYSSHSRCIVVARIVDRRRLGHQNIGFQKSEQLPW
jgi:hypothetical protein